MISPSTIRASNWLAKARARFGERFDYSKVEYINTSTKIIIVCSEHGDFEQWPSDHVNSKHGCPKCGTMAGVNLCIDRNPNHFSNAGMIGNQRDVKIRFDAALKTKSVRIAKGEWIDDSQLDTWRLYKRTVCRLTRRVTRTMNLVNIGRSNSDFQVDHIVSKLDGFRQGIAPEVISHPANLRVISATENRTKSSRSELSVAELKRKIEQYDLAKRNPQ